jgi:hypothetical protein
VTGSTSQNDNKGVSVNPVKPLHSIAGKHLIIIDELLLKRLGIGEGVQFEQVLTSEGILLRLKPPLLPDGVSSPAPDTFINTIQGR